MLYSAAGAAGLRSVQHHQTPLHLTLEMLIDHQVFLHHIPRRAGKHPDLAVLLDLLQGDIKERLEVIVVVFLQRHGIQPVGDQRLAVQRQRAERLLAAGPDDPRPVGELVKFRVLPLERLIPQDMADHALQLGAGDLEHIHRIIVGQALRQVGIMHHRAQLQAADGAGAHQHQVDAEAVPQDIGDEIAQRRFPVALGVGKLAGEPCDDTVIFFGGAGFVALDERLHLLIPGTVGVVNGDHLPGKGIDGVEVGIHHNVKAPDLIGAGARLYNVDIIDLAGLLHTITFFWFFLQLHCFWKMPE